MTSFSRHEKGSHDAGTYGKQNTSTNMSASDKHTVLVAYVYLHMLSGMYVYNVHDPRAQMKIMFISCRLKIMLTFICVGVYSFMYSCI
jgi:hypothetical protein